MLRSTLSLIALALFAGAAAAEEYRDPGNQYRLTMPDGWKTKTDIPAEISFMIVSPRTKLTGGNCNLLINEMPKTKAATQADIDVAGAATFTEEFWRKSLEGAQLTNVKIEKSGARAQQDRQVFFVRSTSDVSMEGRTFSVAQMQDVHLVPGRGYVLTCTALAKGFPFEETDFTAIMASFEPIVETPTAMLRSPRTASLTLYERPGFAGVSRVITRDISDLTSFGWSRPAASFSVAGAAAWEVCDGTNFSGRCRELTAEAGALPALTVLSARRVVAQPSDVTSVAQSMSQALRASVAATRLH